jgi:hypothetical protein
MRTHPHPPIELKLHPYPTHTRGYGRVRVRVRVRVPNAVLCLQYFTLSEAQPDGETPQIVDAFQGWMARALLHVVWLMQDFITFWKGKFFLIIISKKFKPDSLMVVGYYSTFRATSHMRLGARDHYTSSTLSGGKGGAGPSSLHAVLEGPTEYVNARWM